MKLGIKIIAACILLSASVGTAQQSSPEQPKTVTSTPGETSERDQRGTKKMPFVVEALTPPKTDAEAAQEKKDRNAEASNRRWTIGLTGVIALAAIAQFIGIVAQVCVYLKQARIMSGHLRAAQDTVCTMRDEERRRLRAYVSVTPIKVTDTEPGGVLKIETVMKNHGATPANQVRSRGTLDLVHVEAPLVIDEKVPSSANRSGTVIFPGETTNATSVREAPLTEAQYALLLATDEVRLTAISIVDYEDIFGQKQSTTILVTVPSESILEEREIREGRRKGPGQMNFLYNAKYTRAT